MEPEIWRNITGYEGYYQISNTGRVKSMERFVKSPSGGLLRLKERIRKPSNVRGYWGVGLCKDNIKHGFLIHRLVALSFIPNPDNKKEVNHKDGNKQNNHVSNLEWVTSSENSKHDYRTGLQTPTIKSGKDNHQAKKVIDIETGIIYGCIKDAAKEKQIKSRTLYAMLSGQNNNKTNLRYL